MKKLILLLFILTACAPSEIDFSIRPGNEEFVVGSGEDAVILSHGLAASPYEVRFLADYLAENGFTVYGIRLTGHGTSVEHLATTKWEDWYQIFENKFNEVSLNHDKVYVGGMSLGALLALKLVEDNGADGVIALAPALVLDDKRANFAFIFKYFTKYSSRVLSDEVKPFYYNKFSVTAVAENVKLGKIVKEDLDKITEPIFIMQYREDIRVDPESSQIVYDSVSSEVKELVWVDGEGHVMILGEGREEYFEKILEFIRKI